MKARLRSRVLGLGGLVVCALLAPDSLLAQPPNGEPPPVRDWPINPETAERPAAHIVRASGAIVIDGRLDEATWQDAEVLTNFVQSKPRAGYPATEPTVVRLLYDSERIYIGARCEDSEPDKLVTPSLVQDFLSPESDIFGVVFDTFLDKRNAFMFQVNPGGALRDAQLFDDSRYEDLAWEGVIVSRTRVEEWGWSVEIAIPFSTLRFDPRRSEQVWGINFMRRVRRKSEDSYWSPLERREAFHRMSRAGTLSGMHDIRSSRNLSFKPFALGSNASGSLVRDRGSNFDGGMDLKYGLTSQLTLDLTYRTDFSQVEVDQEQVNLTRFSLFFPEKRDFFIENSGIFSFGDITERSYRMGASPRDFTFFHSRRIGLEGGQPVPIVGGARLSGTAAGLQLGALNMQTEKTDRGPAENFAIVRARRNIRGFADLGLLFANRQATGSRANGRYNRSYGVDANFRPVPNLIINSYLAATTESDDRPGNNVAKRLTVGWRDRLWDVTGFVKQLGEAFNPGIGFVRRGDMRHSYATVGVHPRPNIRWIQEVNPFVEMNYITDLHSVLETRSQVAGFDTLFLDGSRLELEYRDTFERIPAPFQVGSGALVQPGDYGFREQTVGYSSSGGRPLSGGLTVSWGDFYSGRRTSVESSAIWRLDYHLALDASVRHNDITLGGRQFTADVFGLRATYGFSTTLFTSAFLQHNAATDQRVINIRLDYIHSPLSDLFVVYTERRQEGGGPLEKIFTVKLTKLLAF